MQGGRGDGKAVVILFPGSQGVVVGQVYLNRRESTFYRVEFSESVRSQIHDSPPSINLPFSRGRRSEEIFISGEDRSRGEREEKWSSKTKEISQARPKKEFGTT